MGGLHKRLAPDEAIGLGVNGACIQVHGPEDRVGIVNIKGPALASVVEVPKKLPTRGGKSSTGHTLAFVDRSGEVTIVNVSAGLWRAWTDHETIMPIESFVRARWWAARTYDNFGLAEGYFSPNLDELILFDSPAAARARLDALGFTEENSWIEVAEWI
jgi:hypothetical protein